MRRPSEGIEEVIDKPRENSNSIRLGVLGGSLLAAAAILLLVACGGGGGGGGSFSRSGSDEDQVTSLVVHLAKLIREGEWRSLWEKYTPLTRELCPYEDYLDKLQGNLVLFRILVGDPDKFEVSDVDVEILGDTAFADYISSIDGEDVGSTERDIFFKVDGRWYDVDEGGNDCVDSGEGERSRRRSIIEPTSPPNGIPVTDTSQAPIADTLGNIEVRIEVTSDAAPSGSDAIVSIGTASLSSVGAQAFELTVIISNAIGLGAFDFGLSYDETLVEFLGVEGYEFIASSARAIICSDGSGSQAGSKQFVCASTSPPVCLGGPPGASGTGTLVTLRFRPLKLGEGELTFTTLHLISDDVDPCDPGGNLEIIMLPVRGVDAVISITAR